MKDQPRVLLVTPRYAPLTGGVETHVREIAHRLPSRGFRVSILTTDLDGTLPMVDVARNVELIRVRAYPKDRDYYWSPDVYRVVAGEEWDIVHCQGIHTFVPILAMVAAIRRGTPFFVTFHTGGHSSSFRKAIRRSQWLMLAPLLRRARSLIAVSHFEERLFASVPGISKRRIVVIPNGADLPLQKGAGIVVDPNLIVSLGRLERYKGHQHAIAAMARLVDRLPGIHLRIVGSGQYRAALEATAIRLGVAERVTIGSIDSTDRETVAQLLASAAVVVLLSEYEAHAIAAIEAIALGRPVVVADSTGLHDLVQAGLARGVFSPADSAEVADAMYEEILRPTPRQTGIPTWDDAVARLAELYERALAAQPAVDGV
jgi:glycosyltransferase involved in cell wall biosynthesis